MVTNVESPFGDKEREVERRTFIRLVGGGTLAVGAGALAGCSTDFPAEAVMAWRGPGNEPDIRKWALAHAVLAPNSHNRQPWLVDLQETDAIRLYVDRERLLPETDPWFRQIVVSQGTFLELLVMALAERGVAARVELFPQGEFAARAVDDRPVARVSWIPGGAPPPKDPLFAQILHRHTAKVGYDTTRRVDPAHVRALGDAMPAGAPPHLAWGATLDEARLPELRRLCIDSARAEVGTARTALESSRLMRIGPAEIARHRDGISMMGVMPRVASALGLFDRERAPEPGSSTFEQVMKRFVEHGNTAMGFVWITTDAPAGTSRSAEVWAGRAYVRQQLQATALGLQMHPMSQAPQEFPEMKPYLDALRRLVLGPEAAGARVVQMFSRIGHCADQPHTPRRPVDAIIRA